MVLAKLSNLALLSSSGGTQCTRLLLRPKGNSTETCCIYESGYTASMSESEEKSEK